MAERPLTPSAPLEVERVFEPSRIRRGRLATSPTFFVRTPDGARWRFMRKRDAVAFAAAGGACDDPKHHAGSCNKCLGFQVERPLVAAREIETPRGQGTHLKGGDFDSECGQ